MWFWVTGLGLAVMVFSIDVLQKVETVRNLWTCEFGKRVVGRIRVGELGKRIIGSIRASEFGRRIVESI